MAKAEDKAKLSISAFLEAAAQASALFGIPLEDEGDDERPAVQTGGAVYQPPTVEVFRSKDDDDTEAEEDDEMHDVEPATMSDSAPMTLPKKRPLSSPTRAPAALPKPTPPWRCGPPAPTPPPKAARSAAATSAAASSAAATSAADARSAATTSAADARSAAASSAAARSAAATSAAASAAAAKPAAAGISSSAASSSGGSIFPLRKEQGRRLVATDELVALRAETAVAKAYGLSWAERGPPPPKTGAAEQFWRGQAYRRGTEGGQARWGNRGGKNAAHYAKLAKAGLLKKTPGKAKKGSGKDSGKISGSGGGKSSGKGNSKGGDNDE